MNGVARPLLLLAVLGALAVGTVPAPHQRAARAAPGPTITVNGTTNANTRDTVMTLREAAYLADGDLKVEDLSFEECPQVSGGHWLPFQDVCSTPSPPNAASADTIVFDAGVFPPSSPVTITAYVELDAGNDTLDGSGAGVIITNATSTCVGITSDGNTIKGLRIMGCSRGVVVELSQNNTIGGSSAAERNIISGNGTGVLIAGPGANSNVVRGNYIGTDAAGAAANPNGTGVRIEGGQNNVIGGTAAGDRNVISGNLFGLEISGGGTAGNAVQGNYIGTNAAGTAAIPNTFAVTISNGASNNFIGGSSAAERNVISGNSGSAVEIYGAGTSGNSVEGNYIGTNAAGNAALPNNTYAVLILDSASNNAIGGTAPGQGNLIAFNGFDGVVVDGPGSTGNSIRGNSIHSNGRMGINNQMGGNLELPPPVITGFGSVMGTACPNCTIDVHSDNEDEGQVYEGSATADGAGNWTFDGSVEGPNVTATATDANGNTSELSAPVEAPEATVTPTPTPTATPGATATPTGPTRTLQWGLGWNNAVWSGASIPEEVFACAAGKYAAAYRYVSGGLERYFPGRPEISNMTPLSQYDAFLILITEPVTCVMPVAAASPPTRMVQWAAGWNNAGWSGADGTGPQDAFACAEGSYAAAYRYVQGGLERYFPGRPDISNMQPLSKYDAFLILVTAPVNCAMPVSP